MSSTGTDGHKHIMVGMGKSTRLSLLRMNGEIFMSLKDKGQYGYFTEPTSGDRLIDEDAIVEAVKFMLGVEDGA